MQELARWNNFYVIVGSSAGALIGLQFVVMTLVAQRPALGSAGGGQAFATPTVVHFSSVLFVSALLCAPWHGIVPIALIWGLIGAHGVLYSVEVGHRMRTQTDYQPVFEDWLFHLILPLTTYGILAVSAFCSRWQPRTALFGVGFAMLLLLFIGIHNTWDTLAYHVFVRMKDRTPNPAADETSKQEIS